MLRLLLLLALVPAVAAQGTDPTVSVSGGATLTVSGASTTLSIEGGLLDMGGATETSVLVESGGARVVNGSLRATRPLNAPSGVNVAGIGVVVTSAANLGATTVTRIGETPTVGGFAGVPRVLDYAPGAPSADPVTLAFTYTDAELGSLNEAGLAFYVSTDGGATWSQTGAGSLDAGTNTATLSTTDMAARWALAPALTSEATLLFTSEGWRMLAVPEATTLGAFLGDLWTQGYTGSDNSAGECTVFVFDETVGTFDAGWTCASNATDALAPGDGVMVYVYEDDDLITPGIQGGFPKAIPSVGAVVEPPFSGFGLSYTDGPATPSYSEGWNLVGNPLRSGFDWDAIVTSGGLTQTVYVYDPAFLGGDYRTWTKGLGGDLAGGVVPAFQGYFVKAVAAAPGLAIPLAAVTSDPGVYGRTTGETAPDPFRLALNVVWEGGTETPVSAAFVASAADAVLDTDPLDAIRLTPTAWPRAVVSTEAADGAWLVLNAVPSELDGPVDLPLAVAAEGYEPGPLAFALTGSGTLPTGWSAVVVDHKSGTETALAEGVRIVLHLDMVEASGGRLERPEALGLVGPASQPAAAARVAGTIGSTGDRYALRVGPATAVGTDASAPVPFGLEPPVPNPASGSVLLTYGLMEAGPVRIAAYDALGREVAVATEGVASAGRHEARLDVRHLAPGVYVLRMTSPAGAAVRTLTVVR